jgi:uncharacterized protein YdeI (YjbR/CyaY-like superfamily)
MRQPTFFATPAAFRAWLERHHAGETELLVGFFKKGTGKPSITWPESVDEALCFGWIDGVRRSLGDEAYCIRFTPRKRASHWSLINVARVAALRKQGKMTAAGESAFAARRAERTGLASFERKTPAKLSNDEDARLRRNGAAATFFESQPPWYQRAALHWVTSAKRPETRQKRFEQLVEDSAAGRTVPPLTRPGQKSDTAVKPAARGRATAKSPRRSRRTSRP